MERRKIHPPFCFRLTPEERLRLEHDAGNMPLGAYVRSCIFAPGHGRQRRLGKRPVKDQQALSRVLAELGQTHIANNLNQLARAANSGSLPVCQETGCGQNGCRTVSASSGSRQQPLRGCPLSALCLRRSRKPRN